MLEKAPKFKRVMTAHRYGLFDGMYVSECPDQDQCARRASARLGRRGEVEAHPAASVCPESEFMSSFGVRGGIAHPRGASGSWGRARHRARVDRVRAGRIDLRLVRRQLNWRGPIWMPTNYVLIQAIERYHRFLGNSFKVKCRAAATMR
jgi:hypothetical protein